MNSILTPTAEGTQTQLAPFQLAYYCIQLHQEGYSDELIFLPICSVCRQPIRDFSMGNLIVRTDDSKEWESVGIINDGDRLLRVPGEVFAVHFECDPGLKPWTRLSNVLRSDQRFEWEKSR